MTVMNSVGIWTEIDQICIWNSCFSFLLGIIYRYRGYFKKKYLKNIVKTSKKYGTLRTKIDKRILGFLDVSAQNL